MTLTAERLKTYGGIARLQDSVAPFSFAEVEEIVTAEPGPDRSFRIAARTSAARLVPCGQ